MKTPQQVSLEEAQARAAVSQRAFIDDVRCRLDEAENARLEDKLIWQRAVRFGPMTAQRAVSDLRAAMAAADQYATDLAAELGLATTTGKEPSDA